MTNPPESVPESPLRFTYRRSPYFRAIPAAGIFGGLTPNGHLEMTLFSERRPYPDTVDYMTSDGKQLREVSRDQEGDFERELEVAAVMTLETARALMDWIQTKLDEAVKVGFIEQPTRAEATEE